MKTFKCHYCNCEMEEGEDCYGTDDLYFCDTDCITRYLIDNNVVWFGEVE